MKKKLKYRYSKKYNGFIKKHLKMWLRKVIKEFLKHNLHIEAVDISEFGYCSFKIKECPYFLVGIWPSNKYVDDYIIFADWIGLIDKFKPSRCPFEFKDAEDLLSTAKYISSLNEQDLDKYILNHNSCLIEKGSPLRIIKEDLKLDKYCGLYKKEWDKAYKDRYKLINEAIKDNNICIVCITSYVSLFRNIPGCVYIVIEDAVDKISEKDWNDAWKKWRNLECKSRYSRYSMKVVSKSNFIEMSNKTKRIRRKFRTSIWKKGEFIKK